MSMIVAIVYIVWYLYTYLDRKKSKTLNDIQFNHTIINSFNTNPEPK